MAILERAVPRGGRTTNGRWSSSSPDRELEVDLPADVLEVVAMEVHRAVLVRREMRVRLATAECVTRDAPGWHVHAPAVPTVARSVGHAVARDVGTEVPRANAVEDGRVQFPIEVAGHAIARTDGAQD
jgi:hypothetical protein